MRLFFMNQSYLRSFQFVCLQHFLELRFWIFTTSIGFIEMHYISVGEKYAKKLNDFYYETVRFNILYMR